MFWVLLLLMAWAVAGTACTRLCLAAVRAAAVDADDAGKGHDLTLYEAAFLSGGPARVADLTLVSMARQHRLLLAHTGWATVVDPRGRDPIERSVIGAIGPEGQSRSPRCGPPRRPRTRCATSRTGSSTRASPYRTGPVRRSPPGYGRCGPPRSVVLVLGATALLTPGAEMPRGLVALWFALPLALTLSCLAIARVEVHPYSHWASPAGQQLLGTLARHAGGGADDRTYLTSVAVRGIRAVGEPDLRAAFAHREQYREHFDE
ncbi:TIGR04222 domain-containing membrane protein [Streptomyces sp. L7]